LPRRIGTPVRRLIVLLLWLGLVLQSGAVAQEPVPYAGVVINPGNGTVTYAYVPLEEEVTGVELLRRSGVSLVTIGFGGLGEGVCQIEQTGCEIGPCRSRLCQTGDPSSPYWRYFQQSDTGEWVASPLGGGATKVEPGEIDGWSWSPDEPNLPLIDISDIPRLAGAEDALDEAHIARYDASGNLLEQNTTNDLEKRSYVLVIGTLAAVAIFAVILKFRPRAAV
jgi:YD repeat-containing protein